MEKVLVFLGATLVLIVPSVCSLVFVDVGTSLNGIELQELGRGEDPPPIVTLAEFEQITKSMSYQEVIDVIGDPGFEAAPKRDAGDVESSLYVWRNSDASHMKATFRNGRLVDKAQMYLE